MTEPTEQQPPQFVNPVGGETPPTGVYYPPHYYEPAPPKNDAAIASIVVASSSLALLVMTAGLFAPFSVIASVIAVFLGHKGKEDVDLGKTTVHRDTAVAGYWMGLGGALIAAVALAFWVWLFWVILSEEITWS